MCCSSSGPPIRRPTGLTTASTPSFSATARSGRRPSNTPSSPKADVRTAPRARGVGSHHVDQLDLKMDLGAGAEWMSRQGLGEGPLDDVSAVTGGTQNVMLRF